MLISLLLVISSTSAFGYDNTGDSNEPSCSVDDPKLVSIIEDINALKEKVYDSPRSSWKKPASIRKFVMLVKLTVLKKQVAKNDLETAHDKMVSDIKPKLTNAWVTDEELQAEFCVDCDNILAKIEAVINPDVDPPVIILTSDQTISDGDAIGGLIIEWTITDESGISDATVNLNGEVIASYSGSDSISDSYLLANTPGDNLVEISAVDNNGLASSAQSTISITDDDTTAPTITIIYVGSGTDADPGYWYVRIEDLESGIDEVLVLINGFTWRHDENLGGMQIVEYEGDPEYYPDPGSPRTGVPCPGSIGIQSVEVITWNSDKDWDGDQESATETDTVEIVHDPTYPPPNP